MSAYWMAQVEVTDPEAYGRYARLATDAIVAHGGVILARGGAYVQLEGRDRARNVLIRFPDLAAAEACYRSPAYQEALGHARGAAERDIVIVEGAD